MRRIAALLSLACFAAACGGTAPLARSQPAPVAPSPHLRLAASDGTDAAFAPEIYPVRPMTYALDGPLADLGPSATVRQLVPHHVTDADVRRIASALGVDPAAVTISTAGGTTNVSYNLGGPLGVAGSGGGASGGSNVAIPPVVPSPTETTAPADVPDPAAAQQVAHSLLDRAGLLGPGPWAVTVADAGGVAVACAAGVPCPTVPPTVVARTVTFDHVVDGATLHDTGWSVTVGSHGRIESVSGSWASLADVGSYLLRSTRAVFADLQAGKAHFVGPQPMMALGAPAIVSPFPSTRVQPVVVHVVGVSLGYATWSAYDGAHVHTDVVPTYRFRARADGGTPYDIEVLALDPSAFGIVNPAPVPTPLPKVIPEPAPAPVPGGVPSGVPSGGAGTATGSSPGR
jgi:hypothetical protein